MSLAPDDPRHGTVNGYRNWRCRCASCRAAQASDLRDYCHRTGRKRPLAVYLAERRATPPAHGTESRYSSPHKCRCDDCRRASTDGRARRRTAA